MAEYEAFRDAQTPANLQPCSNCGRTFNPETLERHEKVCHGQKQRKVFDSRKMRLQGTEASTVKRKASPPPSKSKDKANWRAKHENLIATLKAARGQGPAVAPVVDPGYVECPYCNRNFNEHAAERHIPFCKEQSARMPKTSVNKKSSLNKRTQYKPPLPGSKKSNLSNMTSDGGSSAKQRTPANRVAQNSGGIARRSPAPSPTMRRKNYQDDLDHVRGNRTQEKKNSYNDQYKAGQRQQQQHRENYGMSGRGGSGSDSSRTGSGKEPPAWLREFKNTEDTSILPDRKTDASSAGSRGRHSGRQREMPSRDELDFDEKPIRPARRDSGFDADEFGSVMSKPTAIGVVRPSSRQLSGKDERTPSGRRKLANFCHECGTKYPVAMAKFCCECGVRRMHVEQI